VPKTNPPEPESTATLRFGILTASDRSSRGERPDLSGPALTGIILAQGWQVTRTAIVPDDRDAVRETLATWADGCELDIILTTGGTGFAPRDVTPEATRLVIDREAPGLAEAIRLDGMKTTPHAMLSRAVAGIRGRTIIINLPGNPKAAVQSITVLLSVLAHAVELLRDEPGSEKHH
jgi:molybdopterin adenylyltransferase